MDNKSTPLPSNSVAAAALEALQTSKAKQDESHAISGKDITSLNKFLQWSTAHTDASSQKTALQNENKTAEQLKNDSAWLDAAFPDMYADVKALIHMLTTEDIDTSTTVEILESLQEQFMDLNHAVNIDKLGALDPVLKCTQSPSAEVRAAAVWVLGTALQDLQEVKEVFMAKKGHEILAKVLTDEATSVRAKAVMAASALLRNSTASTRSAFGLVGGVSALRTALVDDSAIVRRRARFFLQHAPVTGNDEFVAELLQDWNGVAALVLSMEQLDVEDVADVEAAVGALTVLVDSDKQGLLRVSPELPGVVDSLAKKCTDGDIEEMLLNLANQLG